MAVSLIERFDADSGSKISKIAIKNHTGDAYQTDEPLKYARDKIKAEFSKLTFVYNPDLPYHTGGLKELAEAPNKATFNPVDLDMLLFDDLKMLLPSQSSQASTQTKEVMS